MSSNNNRYAHAVVEQTDGRVWDDVAKDLLGEDAHRHTTIRNVELEEVAVDKSLLPTSSGGDEMRIDQLDEIQQQQRVPSSDDEDIIEASDDNIQV